MWQLWNCGNVQLWKRNLKFNLKFHFLFSTSSQFHNSKLLIKIRLKRLPKIHKKPLRSLPSPAIIYRDIGSGIFIEFYS
jgi:hypothetical protein